MSLSKV